MLKAAVVGATGYTGEELVRILSRHPKVRLAYVAGKEDRARRIQEIFPYLEGTLDLPCKPFRQEEAAEAGDVIFLSLPHTVSMKFAPYFLSRGKRVVDVSADYRLKEKGLYERFYGTPHADPENLDHAVYGLPEFDRARIRRAKLVANPGCYSTAALLGLLPLVEAGVRPQAPFVIDAKSGVTGAGRKASAALNFSEVNENFKAYKVMAHQHEPEIAQAVKTAAGRALPLVFVPHLLPIDRGILCTIYASLGKRGRGESLQERYERRYRREPFVRVLPPGRLPELKHVRGTNQCHIGLVWDERLGMAVIVTAIDNLGKGAAGQAVQNMNLMFGFDEDAGLV